MKADFSRITFRPEQHYRRVLGQQGRVVIDADCNEQTAIDIAIGDRTNYDVIGQSGVPETSFLAGSNGGFAIGLSADSSDLTISMGRMYVDGILVQNEADTTLSTQPFLPMAAGALEATGIAGDGVYGVFLDVWERLVTQVDDPNIVEVALGGPDTSLRSQIAWQVRLGILPASVGPNPACAAIAPPWPASSSGELAAQGGAPTIDPLPCVIPPQSGFTSLENQLYRIEIHIAGAAGAATFKWSRENGSVIAGILSLVSASSATPTYNVQSVGRDDSLGFAIGDWVEFIDDSSEFQNGAGELLTVTAVDPVAMTITVDSAPTTPFDATLHPKLRRWDQTQSATSSGVAVVTDAWIDIENGLQIKFNAGPFNVGDFWIIPARTASTAQSVGTIAWPTDPASGTPISLPPFGITHHYTKLAVLAYAKGQFSAPQGATAVTDCRLFFPPLTSIPSPALAMHVQSVTLAQSGATLPNDGQIGVSDLLAGILVTCDQAVDPASIEPDTCEVILQVPVTAPPALGTQPVVLDCVQTVNGAVIGLAPSSAAATPLQAIFTTYPVPSILGRIRLRGGFIWAAGNPNIHLDGTSFGAPRDGGTDIVLPSGNGLPAGDFEMSFSLGEPPLPPLAVQSLSFDVAQVAGGGTVTGTVLLNQSVPDTLAQGAVITLTQSEQIVQPPIIIHPPIVVNPPIVVDPVVVHPVVDNPVGEEVPIDPIVHPIDPIVRPVDPIVQPIDPIVHPIDPIVHPIDPIVNPIRPIEPSVAPIPPSVTVPAGASSVQFQFKTTTVGLGVRVQVTATASYGNSSVTAGFVVFGVIAPPVPLPPEPPPRPIVD